MACLRPISAAQSQDFLRVSERIRLHEGNDDTLEKRIHEVLKRRIASNNSLFQKVSETAVYALELPQLETE